MMSQKIRAEIKEYLTREVTRYWDDAIAKASEPDLFRPLHDGLAPIARKLWSLATPQSFYTRSGSWWEHVARIIGSHYHAESILKFPIEGPLSGAAEAHIGQIIEDMDRGQPRRIPDRLTDIREVLTVQSNNGPTRAEISDLYILRHDGSEVFFELKNPEPNKAHSRDMKRRILMISALRKGCNSEVYAACAYNPFNPTGEAALYERTITSQFLEVGADWIVSENFWSIIGEGTTYHEIQEICDEVGILTNDKVLSALDL